ncbi:MAG: HesA/MoeB/ThiF family protein [Crocinitomicaceae bacterium]|nr:HesA/MoeB/ThiF family protein [Crocinitomicaceae bacterium]
MLSPKEKYRYDRQIKLNGIGLEGQEKIKNSSVLVIGAGGLGCPVLMYLAGAGVGKIGIVDADTINETNLHRQVLFSVSDIGNNKAFAARDLLTKKNPEIEITAYPKMLDNKLALELFPEYTIIVDATDNFSTRYLINDVCILNNKPFVFASLFKTEGQLSVFNYKNGPTYRCLFPSPPVSSESCEDVGVNGILCGIIGTKQANEVLKMISGLGDVMSGKLEIYDSMTNHSTLINISSGSELFRLTEEEIINFDYQFFCGEHENRFALSLDELKKIILTDKFQIVDIRQDWEEPKLQLESKFEIPLQQLENADKKLDPEIKTIVVCKYGNRSKIGAEF